MKKELFLTPQDDLQKALDSAPNDAFVHLASGSYRQKLVIRTPGLTIIGQGAENTQIVFDDYAQKLDEQGREYITFRTYTKENPGKTGAYLRLFTAVNVVFLVLLSAFCFLLV